MSKRTENEIKKLYEKVFKEILKKDKLGALAKGAKDEVSLFLVQLSSSKKYEEFAKKFARELAKKGLSSQKGIWRKYFNAAKKLHYIALPKTFEEFEIKTFNKAIENNFKMIKSIPGEVIKVLNHKYTSNLIEEVIKGTKPRNYFKKELEKHGVTNAKLIARTEAAKLQTVVLESRATDLGSVAYIWLASNDKRTRKSHREMNGVVVFWNFNKPLLDEMRGHAGEFPNCRCSPQPIFDEDDLNKSNYRVYNYNNDTIVNKTKKELLEALKLGHL